MTYDCILQRSHPLLVSREFIQQFIQCSAEGCQAIKESDATVFYAYNYPVPYSMRAKELAHQFGATS